MFSIRQAGFPAGGVMAALVLPGLLGFMEWQYALVASALLAGVSAEHSSHPVAAEVDVPGAKDESRVEGLRARAMALVCRPAL